ncbi:NADPH:quinone reductase and related Zn-dependent oxidoreductases [Candidatus Scalindua japonica]|uniref:NADPH:quinone reductase and related Zn-dependent oxidoreductases n=1 Tax=Candidatus Scalindua japonica TaxID=1284222 RepID=A0A286TY55_9BACT|nr:hypothetical protein [Candidatus Scalindua japonica]GAX60800.1 NADPH:quinone reductase and related Zn-dependent oxidoreductases [Candidatus Scalindua japonica]
MLNNIFRKLIIPTIALFVFVVLSFLNSSISKVQAVDYIKKPSETHHQSFEPYENRIVIPDPKPTGVTVRVKEVTTYEVVVDESKVATNNVTMADLDLIELKDKKEVNFHQVDCYFYAKVKQTQSKSTDYISSTRWREGEQFWLSDGGKYVEWEPWSEWYTGNKW